MDQTSQRIEMIIVHYSVNKLEFSEKIRIGEARLKQILKGRQNASFNIIQLIHRAYPEINLEWILFGSGEMLK